MFGGFVFLFIVTIVLRIVYQKMRTDEEYAKPLFVCTWLASIVTALLFIFSFFSIIQPGVIGIQKVFGKIQDSVLTEGIAFKNPLAGVTRMSIKTQMFHMTPGDKVADRSVDVLSSDNMSMSMDLTTLIRLDPAGAVQILRFVGDEGVYVKGIILPTLRAALRNVASRHPAQELMSGLREKVGQEIRAEVVKLFTEYFIERKMPPALICEQALLRDVVPPKSIKDAIETKLAAEQERDKMMFVIETAKKEAERKVVEAHGLADAQQIIDRTLTPEYLQWMYIQKLGELINAPNNSTIILPFDQKLTPMLNIGGQNIRK